MSENEKRAQAAVQAMLAVWKYSALTDPDSLTDLLADLMHFASQYSVDFDRSLFQARANFQAETTGEEL